MSTDHGAQLHLPLTALDLSLTASGITHPDGRADTYAPPRKLKGGDRLLWWAETFDVVLADDRPDVVVWERPFLHPGRPAGTMALGGLYGVWLTSLARYMRTRSTVVQVLEPVPPKSLKKAWTGNGNATKDDMRAEAIERSLDVAGLDDNAVDSLALWVLTREGVWS